jgi:hypothetical protein
VGGSCEHGNQLLGSVKGGEFLDQLSLEKECAPFVKCRLACRSDSSTSVTSVDSSKWQLLLLLLPVALLRN